MMHGALCRTPSVSTCPLLVDLNAGLDARNNGYCIGNQCFAVFQDPVDFATAEKNCERNDGQLMTVRSSVVQDTIAILIGVRGDYWIGLQLLSGHCPDGASDLRGFTWITGDNATDYKNWGHVDDVCSSKCVSVSKEELKWTEKPCKMKLNGYLCEYTFPSVCKRFDIIGSESVLYETPLGLEEEDALLVLPMGSIATINPGAFKYICLSEQWTQAPWDCHILKGGCENKCLTTNDQKHVCACAPGTTINANNRSCDDAQHHDPCLTAGCTHFCYQKINDTSVTCMCNHGYTLAEDGKVCKDIDDCVTGTQCPGQQYKCVNTIGSFECRCQDGFEMINDVCVDVDECKEGPCEHSCTNVIGGYNCSCSDGYIASKDPNKCQLHCAFEECMAECDPNDPSECFCPEGYVADVRNDVTFCLDINECDMDACDHVCQNTHGSHICSCYEGHDLVDGWRCYKREHTVPPISISTSTTYPTEHLSVVTPTSVTYPTEHLPAVTPGGLLAIIVCCVVVVLLLVYLVYHILKHCGILEIPSEPKTQDEDGHNLEQVMMTK
ncbi:hypothetical protein DPEC_G00086090 [Dallia pectoralis]|uniref:Uncharacterized protein n=1 Tax=Dallia pectoralis TaxID=75939 RepID=A0ACC2GZR5_DALPE|nr:hypothetical protein DPEC_G00086090 [Dallia pectoralis]